MAPAVTFPAPGRATRSALGPTAPALGDPPVAPTCALLLSHGDTENTGEDVFASAPARPLGEATPHPYLLPATYSPLTSIFQFQTSLKACIFSRFGLQFKPSYARFQAIWPHRRTVPQ